MTVSNKTSKMHIDLTDHKNYETCAINRNKCIYTQAVHVPTRKPPANEHATNTFSSKNTRTYNATHIGLMKYCAINVKK